MKPLLLLLLAGACLAYTPIAERSWVNFKNVPVSAYNSSLLHEAPNIIYAKEILIEERLNEVSKMIDKSLQDFHTNMKTIHNGLDGTNEKSYCKKRLWIRKETRAPTSIRNVVQPPWTGHFWIEEYGLVPVNRLAQD